MPSPFLQEDRQPWQRFTILDLFLLQLGVALGFSFAVALRPLADEGWPFVVVVGAILGPLFCGPLVLFVQWFFRGRNEGLSSGEWLWLSPLLIHPSGLLLAAVFGPIGGLMAFLTVAVWISAQVVCAALAGIVILSVLAKTRPAVPCVWTDRAGAMMGILTNLLLCAGLPLLAGG